jgi:hypothetical protein
MAFRACETVFENSRKRSSMVALISVAAYRDPIGHPG